jgi:hypothetical protein
MSRVKSGELSGATLICVSPVTKGVRKKRLNVIHNFSPSCQATNASS